MADDRVIGYSPTQALEVLEERLAAGDQTALIAAMYIFATGCFDIDGNERPMPEWLRKGFAAAYRDVLLGRAKDWNEVFGNPHPKGKSVPAYKNKISFAGRVYRQVEAGKKRGEPLSELFEIVGKSLGISKSTAQRYYYEIVGTGGDD